MSPRKRFSILLLLAIVTFVAISSGVAIWLFHLPDRVSQHETILLGQDRLVPGSQAALRVIVRNSADATPLPDAEIHVSMRPAEGGKTLELFQGETGEDGSASVLFNVPQGLGKAQILVVETRSSLGSGSVERMITLEREYRLLLTTDKPIYQPGQIIHIRALALSTFDLKPAADRLLELIISDGKGNKVLHKELQTSTFGVAATDFQLATEVNSGLYKISVTLKRDDTSDVSALAVTSEKTVTVEPYVLPKFSVKLNNERTFYQPGARLNGSLQADYFFGKPVADGDVLIEGYTFDVERVTTVRLEGKTDENGHFDYSFELPVYIAGSDLEGGMGRFYIQASVTDQAKHTEVANLSLPVSATPILIEAIPEGGHIRPGLDNIFYVLTSYPDGAPLETELEINFANENKIITQKSGDYGLAEVHYTPTVAWQDILITARDSSGNVAQKQFSFESDYAEEGILLRPDKPVYRIGDTMKLTILTTAPKGTVYLDLIRQGQTVSTRSVEVDAGQASMSVDLSPDLYGNLELHAYKILSSGNIARDTRLVIVDNASDLLVNLSPQCGNSSLTNSEECVFLPGEQAVVDVQVNGQDGKGVQSALGIAVVDESVFALAEQDPAFAKLYFMLERELLEPKYELHGLSFPQLLATVPKEGLEEGSALRQAALGAAQASLSASVPMADGYSLKINTREEAIKRITEVQRQGFSGLARFFASTGLILVLVVLGLNGYVIWRERMLGRSLTLTALFSILWLMLLLPLVFGGGYDRVEIGLLLGLGLCALGGLIALLVFIIRQKDIELAWTFGLTVLLASLVFALIWIMNEADVYLDSTITIPMVLAFFILSMAYLLRFSGYVWQKRLFPAVATLPIASILLVVGWFSLLGMTIQTAGMSGFVQMFSGERQAFLKTVPETMLAEGVPVSMAKETEGSMTSEQGSAVKTPRLRQYFPETMLWIADAVTDENGSLSFEVPVADSITTWRMTALASSQDGRLGNTTAPLKVFQDFFIDLDLPLSLTVGDEVAIPVGVFNYLGETQTVRLELERADWFDLLEASNVKELSIASNDILVVYFRVKAKDFGLHPFKVTAWGSRMSDAIQKEVHVFPDGKQISFSRSDRLNPNGAVSQTVAIPGEAIVGTQKLMVKIYPGVVSQVVEGLDSLLRMPYGCFEQTSSTTYPNILILDYLKNSGQLSPEVQFKAEEYINLGYQRLITFEVGDSGGFSLFGDEPADPMLTAYGLQEFNDMSRVYHIDADLIKRTAVWLLANQNGDGSWQGTEGFHETGLTNQIKRLPVTAYVVWGLADAGFIDESGTQKGVQYLREYQSQADDPYQLALVANALIAADLASEGAINPSTTAALERLAAMAKMDNGGAFWTIAGGTVMGSYGDTGELETTALAALAFLRSETHSDLANAALTFLIKHKDSYGTWQTTQGTVMALKALIESVRAGREDVNATIEVKLNDGQAHTIHVGSENFDVVQMVTFDDVSIGKENRVTINSEGTGTLMYQITGSYYLPWDKLAEYTDLIGKENLVEIEVDYNRTELTVNDTIKVDVVVKLTEAGSQADSAIIDLGLPPGFSIEAQELETLVAYYRDVPQDYPKVERYELTGRQIIVYISNLTAGYPLSFSYHLRAKFPLTVQVPASSVYDYYNPDIKGERKPQMLTVVEETVGATTQPSAEAPLLSGSPTDWLPGEANELVPDGLDLYVASYTNKELASQYDNATDLLTKLNEWGRVISTVHSFLHRDGCLASAAIRWIKVQAVLYQTVGGAEQGYDWVNTINKQNAFRFDRFDDVGEVASISWSEMQSDCVPADRMISLRITFRRYNVVGVVDIGSVAELADEEEMHALAIALADYVDARLLEDAR